MNIQSLVVLVLIGVWLVFAVRYTKKHGSCGGSCAGSSGNCVGSSGNCVGCGGSCADSSGNCADSSGSRSDHLSGGKERIPKRE